MNDIPVSPAQALSDRAVPHVVHRHERVRTAEDVLQLTGFPVGQSVKTLAFEIGPDRLVLVGVPGPAKIKYGPLARALGVPRSALRPAPAEALERIGMEPGGVCPVCLDEAVTVVLDSRVPAMGRVYCGSGQADATFELDAASLPLLAGNPVVAEVAEIAEIAESTGS